ncbi:MAG: hypothetical protein SFV23_08230 [Planctomycetaceae bacterium]|nr:hypothetical protein [Planctomycetaceae bacterium]
MNDPRVLTFYRAAGQRVAAARVLAAAAETLDATYLGGYGLECALKAVISLARFTVNDGRCWRMSFGARRRTIWTG